jgi:hypothetical protein
MSKSSRTSALTEASSLALRVLGSAQLFRIGVAPEQHTPVPLVGKQFALLAYLACAPGRAESRALLIDLFAPVTSSRPPDGQELAERKAGDAFRDLIRQLRSKLGHDIFGELRDDPVRLAAPISCDRDDLLDAWKRRDFHGVVDVYAGEFLPRYEAVAGAEFALWLETERAALARRFAQAARHVLAEDLASASDAAHLAGAVSLARRLRDHDTLSQDAWRFLLRYLVLSGEHDEAAVEAEHLGAFFGAKRIELEPSTRSLVALARSEVGGSQAQPKRVARAESATGALVGRDVEIASLIATWDRARSGQLVHVHISASAGLGKSRLLLELRQRLRARTTSAGGARAIEAKASQSARETRRSFVAELAQRLAERPGGLGVSESVARTLVGLNPSLIDIYKAAAPRNTPARPLQAQSIAAAIQELIAAIALDGPVALLLDDLHWADADSLQILAEVFVGCADLPLLVVSTSRDSCDVLCEAAPARRIELVPLDVDAVKLALTRIAPLPEDEWARQLPEMLWHASLGTPLLLHETLQLLRESSLLIASPRGWTTTNADALFAQLHSGNATRRRIDQLTPSERRLLLLLAIAGSPLTASRLRTAAGQEIAEFNSALTSLERRGLVVRLADEWSVAHDEHAVAMRQAASVLDAATAAASLGRAISKDSRDDIRELRRAGPLLARGNERLELRSAFVRYVRLARANADARTVRALAEEFLGEAAKDGAAVAMCKSQVPLGVRLTPTWRTRFALGGAIAGLMLVGAFVAAPMRRPASPPPDAILAAERTLPDQSKTEVSAVNIDASHWAGVTVKDVHFSSRPWWRAVVTRNGGAALRPDHRGWTGGVAVPDSGVIDIFDLDLAGNKRRITFDKLDDLQPSWAPDNSRFVFVTSRWSRRGHYDLAIYDTLTHSERHLTQGEETDEGPQWSPDGSRIAFIRRDARSWRSRLCLIDADGGGLECVGADSNNLQIAGWSDAGHVWLRRHLAADGARLERMDLATRKFDAAIPGDVSAVISPDGRFAVCRCPRSGHPSGAWIVYPLDRLGEFAVLKPIGADTANIEYGWAPTTPRLPYIARLDVALGPGPPLLGAAYQLRTFAYDTSKTRVTPGVVRWRSENPAIAGVDSTGLLIPYDTGAVTIDASAGGWRTARTTLRIRRPESRTLLGEQWTGSLAPAWIPHGVPTPRIVTDARLGRAFLNNGDGSFFSGAYTSRAIDTRDGLWVDATLSTPLTETESQEQVMWLFAMTDSAAWANWDRITGDGPSGPGSPGCSIRYPWGENRRHFGEEALVSGVTTTARVRAPDSAYTGQPFRVTMQIFPDGSCGVAIDGKALWRGPADFFQRRVHLQLAGNSVDTRILVGTVRVTTGIAPGIAWGPTRK